MKAYKARLRRMDARTFHEWFDGKWISCFDIFSTIPVGKVVGARIRKYYPVQAYLIALEKGAKPCGITNEHTSDGEYQCEQRRKIKPCNIQYIGKFSKFTGHELRRQDNPFALQPEDRRYAKRNQRPILIAYNLRNSSSMNSTS